jgi:hypothetical protein
MLKAGIVAKLPARPPSARGVDLLTMLANWTTDELAVLSLPDCSCSSSLFVLK